MDDANFFWNYVVEKLSAELTPTAIDTWIRPCEPVSFDGSHLVLRVPDEFRKKIISDRFAPVITKSLQELLSGDDVGVILLSSDEQYSEKESVQEDESLPQVPGYTFEDFIVGPSNQFAHAASVAVADEPGTRYNPLFVYGNSGLGKTHLMLAIGYAIKKKEPKKKVAYVKAESFTNELVQAISDGKTAEFKEKYRKEDVLLIDDIQFIAGKKSTQEEFFHTFEALHQRQHQMVITSDRPPKEMTLLDDRLRTRFEGGMMAHIAPPELETRIAIAKRKAALIDLELSDEDFAYIASKVKSNVRKLEGVLGKLGAYSSILNMPVNREIIDKTIIEVDNLQGVPTSEAIIRETCNYYNLTPEQLRSESRSSDIRTARQIAMYLMRSMTSMSFQEIGSALGRNHSTTINAVSRIEKLIETDVKLKGIIRDIESNITNTPGNLE
jgi:chromosomal replication initiator protein